MSRYPGLYSDGQDVICRRCLIPGRGWRWEGRVLCEPCHRMERTDLEVDGLILSDYDAFAEWWTDETLDRVASHDTFPNPEHT